VWGVGVKRAADQGLWVCVVCVVVKRAGATTHYHRHDHNVPYATHIAKIEYHNATQHMPTTTTITNHHHHHRHHHHYLPPPQQPLDDKVAEADKS
jgi:uncharacterized protein GlcG (DUF336 family)